MNPVLFALPAVVLYVATAAWWGARALRAPGELAAARPRLIACAAAALLLHGIVLHQTILTGSGLNLGFYNALSLMGWAVALLVTAAASVRRLDALAVVLLPVAAIGLVLELVFPSQRVLPEGETAGLRIHIVLSIGAYGLLAIAAAQAVVLAIQHRLLHGRQPAPALRMLPPLQDMEQLLMQLLALGFFLLSLSLATGLIFVRDVLAQHLAHKTVFAVLAWLLFGAVLAGRRLRGWRGRRLLGWVLGGFASLVLAYFGTKLVLELILHRV
jgi:ABC-type uncharacterized transport system permease subunit